MVFVVGVELDVAEVQDDGHHLPDALDGGVRKVERPERVHDHSELVGLQNGFIFCDLEFMLG